jgi:hypothetical protein
MEEAVSVLFSVTLSILVRAKYYWIGMHMSGKQRFLAGVGLILRGVFTSREIYGSTENAGSTMESQKTDTKAL